MDFLDYWGRGEWGDIHSLLAPARDFLARSSEDVLVFGHSHLAGRIVMPRGTYFNTGSWTFDDATYVRFEDGHGTVHDWRDGRVIEDEEYGAVPDPAADRSFFAWWTNFYRGWFRYDVPAMVRAAQGDAHAATSPR